MRIYEKVKKRCGILVIAVVICIIFSLFFGWKIPVYLQLYRINLPDGYGTLKTKVILSDVYTLHIIGERVVNVDMELEEFEQYVRSHNTEKQLGHIMILPFFRPWDDYAVFPDAYEDKVPEEEKDHYFVLRYYKHLQ